MVSLGSALGLALVAVVSGGFTCPDYSKIRMSGVAPANFKIEDVSVRNLNHSSPSLSPVILAVS